VDRKHSIEKAEFRALRQRMYEQLRGYHPWLRKTQVQNLSEMVVAMTLAKSVQLADIGQQLPLDSSAEGREQWVRRQLSNTLEESLTLFRPIARHLLAGFCGRSLRLILDPTDLAEDLTIVQVAVAYRGRALPLAWMCVYIKPDTVKEALQLLFAEIQPWLPASARVYLLADREFHGQETLSLIQAQGWIPVVRIKGSTRVELADGTMGQVAELAPPDGQTAFFQQVWLTAWGYGPYSLSVATAPPAQRGHKPADPWFILSTDPAGPQILYWYECRMWVDEMFRDLKSQGFHLEQTRLTHPERIDRLMLVLALAYWWLLGRGIWLDRLHLRRRVDRQHHPKCSLFTLGLRWIHRLLILGRLPDVFLLPIL
jgi:hypothetical protein